MTDYRDQPDYCGDPECATHGFAATQLAIPPKPKYWVVIGTDGLAAQNGVGEPIRFVSEELAQRFLMDAFGPTAGREWTPTAIY